MFSGSLVSKESKVANDLIVQPLVLRLPTVEEKEGIDEQRQVRDERDIERSVARKLRL